MRTYVKIGYGVGTLLAVAIVGLLSLPGEQKLLAKGLMNTGHENLQCRSCHQSAVGTFRQQLQANVKYWLGQRSEEADFGYTPVTNETCLDCHTRPNDRHPVSRFLEPRFSQARQNIQPQLCNSCHSEHNHRRVTSTLTYCVECHQNLQAKNDPLSPSHAQLIAEKRWSSCLTCHDFHGNHIYEVPKDGNKAIPLEKIESYFAGSSSPYSDKKYYQPKR